MTRAVTTSRAISRLVGDAVAQQADAVDLHLDDIAGLHPQRRGALGADAARGAGDDDVAGLEPREGRAVFDLSGNIEDHLADGRLLHHLAVQAGLQPQRSEITGFVGRDHPGTERAGLRKILAGGELVGVALIITHAALIVAGIARDVAPGFRARDVTAAFADDQGEFALEIEIGRDTRADDISEMTGL